MIVQKVWACVAPSDHGRLIQRTRDRVEEAVEQEGVRAERATEVDADQAELGVQAHDREDVLDAQEEQVQGHEASICGNIWTSRRPVSVPRRPLKRKRLNA